jgi:hypothetical protein
MGNEDKAREPEMAKLVSRAGRQATRRRFSDTPGLIREVYASLVECLESRGKIRTGRLTTVCVTGQRSGMSTTRR